VLKAARNHPFARLRAPLSGYHEADALVWNTGDRVCGLGSPEAVVDLCLRLAQAGEIAPGSLLEVPRIDVSALESLEVVRHEYWSILWTRQPHPHSEHDDRVVPLPESEHASIDSLLDVSFPATHNRPGGPLIRRWFGIYEEGQLVAVGADRSQNGVGYLVAIAVMPHRQGVGYGAALTRRIARELLAESDLCALGVTVANTRARELYQRIGFTEGIDLTSVRLA
jgi:GNAT superfamily N-acetyltransferase